MKKIDIEILSAYIISEAGFSSKICVYFVDIKSLKFYECEDRIDTSKSEFKDDFEGTIKDYISSGKLKIKELSAPFMRDKFSYNEAIWKRIKHYSSLIVQIEREEKLNKLINNK